MILFTVSTLPRTVSGQVPTQWPKEYRGELLALALRCDNGYIYMPATDSTGIRVVYRLPKTSRYFTEIPDSIRKKDATNLARMIYSYLSEGVPGIIEQITLVNYDVDNSDHHLDFRWSENTEESLQAPDKTVQERFKLLSEILPTKHLEIGLLKRKVRKSFLAFSFPLSREGIDREFDQAEVSDYSLALGSLCYDYVLQRNERIVSKIMIQFDQDYRNLRKAAYRMAFDMNSSLFAEIKKDNRMALRFIRILYKMSNAPHSVKDKLSAVSYLIQDDIHIAYQAPTIDQKGHCVLDYQCKEETDSFTGNDAHVKAENWICLLLSYCMRDSLAYFDTVTIRFLDSRTKPLYGWKFAVPRDVKELDVDGRMRTLLNCLPFKASSDFYDNDDRVDFTLRDLHHSSPTIAMPLYFKVLGFVANDFVFEGHSREPRILYTDPNSVDWRFFLQPANERTVIALLRSSGKELYKKQKSALSLSGADADIPRQSDEQTKAAQN